MKQNFTVDQKARENVVFSTIGGKRMGTIRENLIASGKHDLIKALSKIK